MRTFELRGASGPTVSLVHRANATEQAPGASRAPEGLVKGHFRRDPHDVTPLLRMGEALRGGAALGHARSPDSTELQLLLEQLEGAVSRGDFVVGEPARDQRTSRPAAPPRTEAPPRSPPAKSPPTELHAFVIRFVDELGEGIGSVPVIIQHATAANVTTGGSGVARVDDSPKTAATARVSDIAALKKALKPKWSAIRQGKILTETDGVKVVELRDGTLPSFDLVADKVRVVSIQPFVSRVRLIGGFFDTGKTFLLPRGLGGARSLSTRCKESPRPALLLVGHTDTAGKPAYNDKLSLDRAESVQAFLEHDVDHWLDWYGAGKSKGERWGKAEDRAMIEALPDAGGRLPTEGHVTWFQRTRGLAVDGKAGPETRRSLVTEYMSLGGPKVPSDVVFVTHGCGENFPREATGDDIESEENRRVEAYFFDKDMGVLPPPKGKNSKPGSLEYEEWQKRAKTTEDHDADLGDQELALRILVDPEQVGSMTDTYVLDDEDESFVQQHKLSDAKPGADGFPQLLFQGLPEGRAYRLQCIQGGATFCVFDYTPIPELQARFGTGAPADEPSDELLAVLTPGPEEDGAAEGSGEAYA